MPIRKLRPLGTSTPSGRNLTRSVYKELVVQGFRIKDIQAVVEATLALWKRALQRHEEVEVPFGKLKVVKSPPERRVFVQPPRKNRGPMVIREYTYPYMIRFYPKRKMVDKVLNDLEETSRSAGDYSTQRFGRVGLSILGTNWRKP